LSRCFFRPCKARWLIIELLSDAKRREIEEVRNASNSPKDDGTYCRYRDMRPDGLPIDIDIRVLQTGKLRDGRFLVFVRFVRPLGFPAPGQQSASFVAQGFAAGRISQPYSERAFAVRPSAAHLFH
jgi:hypothetical protein